MKYLILKDNQLSIMNATGFIPEGVVFEIPEGDYVISDFTNTQVGYALDVEKRDIRLLNKDRVYKLELIRVLRKPFLDQIDLFCNELSVDDCLFSKGQIKKYRRDWLDITIPFKKDPSLLDNLDIDKIVKPILGG